MDIYELTNEINNMIKTQDSIPLNTTEELYLLYGKMFLEKCDEVPRFKVLRNGQIELEE